MWIRLYIDDVLVVWECGIEDIKMSVNKVNNMNQNIKFKEEIGGNEINYFDFFI